MRAATYARVMSKVVAWYLPPFHKSKGPRVPRGPASGQRATLLVPAKS